MCKFRLLTDSTADLPASLVEELDLQVYPMAFVLEEKAYRDYPDGRELDIHAFYESLRHGKMSSSSQINQQQMVDWVSPFLENGEDVLYLAFSSGLSGTYQSARLAQEELRERFPDRTFTVVDSLCASMGEGLLAYYAATMRQQGCTLEETAAWLEENKLKLCHWFTVDDLHHLKRGGRVSPATAVVGTMLNIKPVLHVDDNGHLIPMEKVRGPPPVAGGAGAPHERNHRKPRGADDFHQPRRLPAGRRVCGGPHSRNHDSERHSHPHHRPGDRHPFRPRHRGGILPWQPPVTIQKQKTLGSFIEPSVFLFVTGWNPGNFAK